MTNVYFVQSTAWNHEAEVATMEALKHDDVQRRSLLDYEEEE